MRHADGLSRCFHAAEQWEDREDRNQLWADRSMQVCWQKVSERSHYAAEFRCRDVPGGLPPRRVLKVRTDRLIAEGRWPPKQRR
jgi:hypothetical protein